MRSEKKPLVNGIPRFDQHLSPKSAEARDKLPLKLRSPDDRECAGAEPLTRKGNSELQVQANVDNLTRSQYFSLDKPRL